MSTEPDDIFEGDPFDPEVVRATENKTYESAQNESDAAKAWLATRKQAYMAVFNPGNRTQGDIDIVLKDLGLFCRAMETRYAPDETRRNMLEGRAEVFYRILSHTRLDTDTLFRMLTDAKINTRKG